jgi:regulatory protein
VATVTALRAEARGRVRVDLDGAGWRTLPEAAVAAAGLRVGLELDRPRLRELRRALRRSEALAAAARALRHRDLPAERVAERLERAAVAPAARADALETLARVGLVDDGRYAHGRAAALAARGLGDAAIRFGLEHDGVAGELVEEALGALEPERERAGAVAAARGASAKTARLLARRGFGEDAIDAALGGAIAPES